MVAIIVANLLSYFLGYKLGFCAQSKRNREQISNWIDRLEQYHEENVKIFQKIRDERDTFKSQAEYWRAYKEETSRFSYATEKEREPKPPTPGMENEKPSGGDNYVNHRPLS